MKKFLSILGGIILTFAFSSAVHAAPFQNGSFEIGSALGEYDTLYEGYGYISGWNIEGVINYIGSYWNAYQGSRSIDLNGYGPGSISQTFDTVPGVTYNVSFWMSGNPAGDLGNKTLTVVSVNKLNPVTYSYDTIQNNNSLDNMNWINYIYSFVATGTSTTLTFTSTDTAYFWGPAIDNVVVSTNLPTSKDMCKDGQWQTWNSFKSQGDCISYIATGGKNLPSGQ